MKKIFAISVLSVMAVVVAMDAWATENPPNYNLATVNYVEGAVLETKDLVIKSDKQTSVAGGWNPSGFAGSDYKAPTIKYMENSIAEAVAGVDTSGLVDKAQVIKSDDKALSDGTTDLSSANADVIVPTVANVEANFAPRIGDAVYSGTPNDMDSRVVNIDVTDLPRGEYSVIVSVDDSGNVSFRWVPIQIDSCDTTAGGTCGPE
ncbi:MAG: hypothetical protein IKB49_04380 [Alphaproteobacteria bacterium]|nr:hypothetical protein [Alphaproteobacteria bacterium]